MAAEWLPDCPGPRGGLHPGDSGGPHTFVSRGEILQPTRAIARSIPGAGTATTRSDGAFTGPWLDLRVRLAAQHPVVAHATGAEKRRILARPLVRTDQNSPRQEGLPRPRAWRTVPRRPDTAPDPRAAHPLWRPPDEGPIRRTSVHPRRGRFTPGRRLDIQTERPMDGGRSWANPSPGHGALGALGTTD